MSSSYSCDEYELIQLLKAFHYLFKFSEGEHDVYPICVSWTQQWLETGSYEVQQEERSRIIKYVEGLKYIKSSHLDEFRKLVYNRIVLGFNNNVGFAIAPLLFTWNYIRFKEYFNKKRNFNLINYFEEFGNFIYQIQDDIKKFKNKKLLIDGIDPNLENLIKNIFNGINKKLSEIGIYQNEKISTIKTLHLLNPHYFPLIDNEIAKKLEINLQNADDYLNWMKCIKQSLSPYINIAQKIEKEFETSILKIVDEVLYLVFSKNCFGDENSKNHHEEENSEKSFGDEVKNWIKKCLIRCKQISI